MANEQSEAEDGQAQVLDLVANHGAESIIKYLAVACRIAAEVDAENNDWPGAGTHNYYARTLEELVGKE